MTKTRAEIVRYLVDRKFPYWKSVLAGQSLSSGISGIEGLNDKRSAVRAYEAELQAMPDPTLRELQARELDKERQQAQIRADQEEKARFFNQPSADADYSYWAKASYWTLDEAVALTLGKNPEKVRPSTIAQYQYVSPFPQTFHRLKNLAVRAKDVGKLFDPVYPSIFVNWATENGIELPPEMREAVSKVTQLQTWQEISKKQAEVIEQLQHMVSGLRAELEEARGVVVNPAATSCDLPTAPTEKPQSVTERDNMLKVILAVAMDAYGHDPEAKRSTATKDVQSALHTAGLNLSDDTIRRFIKQAEERLDEWRADEA